MSLISSERGRVARNASALFAFGAIMSGMLGLAYVIGSRSAESDIAKQEALRNRHRTEQTIYQQQLDKETPQSYTSEGRRLVPKAAYIAHFIETPVAPLQAARDRDRQTGNRLLWSAGVAAIAAAGLAMIARRQRRNEAMAIEAEITAAMAAQTAAAETQVLLYLKPQPVGLHEIPPTAPEPQIYGKPVQPTLRERRAAQAAVQPSYDPFAISLNHAATSLTFSETTALPASYQQAA